MDNLNQRRAAQVRWLKVAMGNMEVALDGSALHAFGDASETAYGAVVYLVVTEEDHSTISNLVMAKSAVAFLKKMTLPRLEPTEMGSVFNVVNLSVINNTVDTEVT
ncbi:hypothetical protein T07_7428 [Trichinella nelsoni]|uniref:Uncharacterized protein n=1 Tax=Trichinella nelsoni TaxID=6336 RepID=A0A0V0RGI7_9BILA|nr:hypothetical protein T07_7428 [Trichinella nelsoni]